MARVILLRPDETYPADTDHLLLTEMRRPSGEPLADMSGAVRLPNEIELTLIVLGAKLPTLEIALEEAQAYAAARGIPVIYVRREA